MTLTKSHIIDSLNNHCGYSKIKSIKLADVVLDIVKTTLESGEDVLISGFGKFNVSDKQEHRGRHPSNGSEWTSGVRRTVSFSCSPSLKEKINGIE